MSSSASSSASEAGPRHAVFLSYASADRVAARNLRDSLVAAGLDVWLDEEELAGGEAWDAKIRQQIRTCTYFMPIISATTEARREGYFRREWRLAVERTLDFADDVLFLVPVVIDGTPDQGARVPEKFSTVQWLRCPGGSETPSLRSLAQRLARGSEPAPTRASPTAPPPPPMSRRERRGIESVPRPFPTFPAFPSPGKRLHFLYELLLWTGHTVTALWLRLPRWLRAVATIVIVFKIIGFVFNRSHSDGDERSWDKYTRQENPKAPPTSIPNAALLKEKIINAAGAALDTLQGQRPLAIVTFTAADPSLMDSAVSAFAGLHASLKANGHGEQVAVSLAPLSIEATDVTALARASALQSHWLLTGIVRAGESGGFNLEVKLYDTTTGKVSWQDTRSGTSETAEAVGTALATDVLTHVSLPAAKAERSPPPPLPTPPPE